MRNPKPSLGPVGLGPGWLRLSVVVLTWNEERNIAACLAALAGQTTRDFEVILLDAASPDRTVAIAESARAWFPVPLRIEVASTRISIGAARNLGVHLARAPVVAFMSADAEADPHWVEEATTSSATHDLVFGRQVHTPTSRGVGAAVRGLRYNFPNGSTDEPVRYASNVNAAVRRSVLQRFPFGTSPTESVVDDLLLARRARSAGHSITYNSHMVIRHRDVASARQEFVKNRREGRACGAHASELGLDRAIMAWACLLVAGVSALVIWPGWPTLALGGAFLWLPTLRRAWRRRRDVRPVDLALGTVMSPLFDLAFLFAYVRGLSERRRPPSFPHETPGDVSMTASNGTKPAKPTVFIVIDAGRADYIRPDSMPFLHSLSRESLNGSFISPPGFAQRTAFFTGRYPDTSNNLSAFVFDPEHSPFKWLRMFGALPNLVQPYKAFVPVRRMIKYISKWTSDSFHPDPAWIPTKYQPFFRPCEDSKPVYDPGALGATSIYDLCRKHGKTFTYRAHPLSGDDDAIFKGLVKDLKAGSPYDLYVAQFSILDQQGHIHGPHTEKIQKECLTELDRKLKAVHAAMNEGYSDWNFMVVADHGMAPVKERVDVPTVLKALPVKAAKDYVVFVNSTLCVFWYLTDKGRNVIEAALPGISGTRVVSDAERKERRIPTNRQWGDRMLAADAGVLFWPDYFHVKDSVIRGMHGYFDKREETYGMGVFADKDGSIGGTFDARPLIDVFPTLCDLLGFPVPPTAEGESVFEQPPHRRSAKRSTESIPNRRQANAPPWPMAAASSPARGRRPTPRTP